MRDYLGWVPTITGHLSFSTIGTGKNPSKEFKYLSAVGDRTLYIVAQKRRTTDAVFGWLGDCLNALRSREGHSVYVLFAEANAESKYSELTGHCVELTVAKHKALKGTLQAITAERDELQQAEMFKNAEARFVQEGEDRPWAVSAVTIHRTGKTRISFSDEDPIDAVVERRNASQVFFFLRDITHRHQHHSPSSDTILDVMPASDGAEHWKRETIYSLYRWVIHRKRDQSVEQLINCKGVLAYASSFEKIHYNNTSEGLKGLPAYNHDTTLASVEARLDALRERAKKIDLPTLIFSRVLPIFTVLITLLIPIYSADTLESASSQQRIVGAMADWASSNIITTVGGLFLVSLLSAASLRFKASFRFSQFMHDLLRAALAFSPRRWPVVLVLLVLIAAIAVLTLATASGILQNVEIEWMGWDRV